MVTVPKRYRYREFLRFLVVLVWVSEKIGIKKSLGIESEKFGTEKSTGIGIGNVWYQKKYRYRFHLKFWVPSHSDPCV